MQSLMGETPKTALHRCLDAVAHGGNPQVAEVLRCIAVLMQSLMGETPKTALHRCLDAVAHGGNPQDRAASLS